MDDVRGLAAAIRSARREAGITQADLADLADISVRTVRSIEAGSGNPSLTAVVNAANAVGLSVKAL